MDTQTVDHFRRHGWVLTSPFAAPVVERLRTWVDEVQHWPDEGEWLHYRELTDLGPRLCRSENFVPFHAPLRTMLTSGVLLETAGALLGEPAVLYKEKINYKLAGGAGYSPHQDAPAYRFVDTHVSCMIAIDDSLRENGCLEVVADCFADVLPMNERGCIADAVVATLNWTPVEVRAGQVLWFHSRTPHRSGPNHTTRDRRAVYPTYNAAAEGDLRAAYYAQKLREFRHTPHTTGTVQVSLINDFEGRPV